MKKNNSEDQSIRQGHSSSRTHRLSIMLNDEEMRAVDRYIEKYKVKNKSRFVREALISTILRQFEEDHPTLF